ncbi:phospholipase D-like domain-containing protein [Paracoccus fistulariae]|uniref:Phospholipase D n=1 Tax=Paracoccus fistulariae TaxID=658446 RepID=A0ABY7SNN9_9RHOB|nr:phospholipase D-like domain-containing protein [Paracoccus fistulariae]MDB6180421.1 phospholipase D-like domain-containing protein [Paracoccus fistulariae]WCR08500.1 phospholipase [Paracoccus fistulariae]
MTDLTFQPGRNCWRVAHADRFSVIVDGKDYFRTLRESLLKARRFVILVGWDFDFEIEMLPGESDDEGNAPDGFPNAIGPFFDALVTRREGLDIYLLKWSGGALIAPARTVPTIQIKLMSPDQLHLGFDGRHPIGACHHQKIVVIDDSLAFCGGIDVTEGRWDTRAHGSYNPLRVKKDGEVAQPWHDSTTLMSGDAASALSELCRSRWQRAMDEPIGEEFSPGHDIWPKGIEPDFTDIEVAIARTAPPERHHEAVNEIETLYLDSIAAATDCIYLESQYFAADGIADAIRARLQEPDGPEVVIINPNAAQGMVEDEAMHVTRSRLIEDLEAHDPHGRFTILYPVNETGQDIYVHSKTSIIDDAFLRIGSSNIDRRSMGFDTESDVALIARRDQHRQRITEIRNGLLAEHLAVSPEQVVSAIDSHGSVIGAIRALNDRQGRGLRPITPRKETMLGKFLSDTRLFDPRYRSSAQARIGITSRHVVYGAVALAAGVMLWRRYRRKRD